METDLLMDADLELQATSVTPELEKQLVQKCERVVESRVEEARSLIQDFDNQVYLANHELGAKAGELIRKAKEEMQKEFFETKQQMELLRSQILAAQDRREEEEAKLAKGESSGTSPFALASDLSNLPEDGTEPPLAMTYRGYTIVGRDRIGTILQIAKQEGYVPESLFRDPQRELEKALDGLSLGVEGEDVRKRRTRRRRRARRNPGGRRKVTHPSRIPPRRDEAVELQRANADLLRIRAEREQLRLELQALRAHCHARGIGEPRVPLPPASHCERPQLGFYKGRRPHFNPRRMAPARSRPDRR
jgi:hypothetical protein